MPRKFKSPERFLKPDPRFKSKLVSKFINCLMWQGKKSTAQAIFYGAMDIIGERTNANPIEVFEKAMKNVMPVVEVKPRRVGGATYQVPIEVRPDRRQALGIRWLVQFSRRRTGRTMAEKLAGELLDAANMQGASVKKREDSHRMAEANKAFGHYRW